MYEMFPRCCKFREIYNIILEAHNFGFQLHIYNMGQCDHSHQSLLQQKRAAIFQNSSDELIHCKPPAQHRRVGSKIVQQRNKES